MGRKVDRVDRSKRVGRADRGKRVNKTARCKKIGKASKTGRFGRTRREKNKSVIINRIRVEEAKTIETEIVKVVKTINKRKQSRLTKNIVRSLNTIES